MLLQEAIKLRILELADERGYSVIKLAERSGIAPSVLKKTVKPYATTKNTSTEVVLHYEVYRYGELAESKSAIAGKTHWQYNGSLKKPLYCTPQEDNDYGEIPEGISAEDFEEPDAMPF